MQDKLKEKYNQLKIGKKNLYLIANSSNFDTETEFLDVLAAALSGGVDVIQLRGEQAKANTFLNLAKKVKELCAEFDATFIIKDRVDIAYIVEADGVHLGQNDIDIHSARKILGSNAIIGRSTHNKEHAIKAQEDGADYITIGPIFANETSCDRVSADVNYLEWVRENIGIIKFAVGGINLDNCEQIFNSGFNRISVSRAIINSDNPRDVADKFKEKISDYT